MSKNPDDGEIIAMSPIVHQEACFRCRLVIRDLGSEFVVHMQILEPGKKPWYLHGNYVPKRDDPTDALKRAWDHFDRRSRRLLQIEPILATT
jgi:hypothetical protein